MRNTLAILIMLILSTSAFSQAPDSLWSQTYGGSEQEYASSVQNTSDGGYILMGSTQSFGAGVQDFWLVKTNANGDSLWSSTFGGSSWETGNSVQQTTDGGYILAGYTWSFAVGPYDFWLVKTDANGDSLWSNRFGGSGDDKCYAVKQTSDGGYALVGRTATWGAGNDDIWLVKTDANGDSVWSQTYGGAGDDQCSEFLLTPDGGYMLAGRTQSFGAGGYDFWLLKTNADGDTLWTRLYGGSNDDVCYSIQQTTDGGYILAGYTESFGAVSANFWLVKTNANGDSLWSSSYGGNSTDYCYSVQQTADSGYILGGYTESFGTGNSDFWVVKTDATGDSLWSQTFGGSSWELCLSLQKTHDMGYVLAGYTESFGAGDRDFWLVKIGSKKPYGLTVEIDDTGSHSILRWIAPLTCDYKVYSTTNPNHDGSPPGLDWTLEVTLTDVPGGSAYWIDFSSIVAYKNYIVVSSCP